MLKQTHRRATLALPPQNPSLVRAPNASLAQAQSLDVLEKGVLCPLVRRFVVFEKHLQDGGHPFWSELGELVQEHLPQMWTPTAASQNVTCDGASTAVRLLASAPAQE